MPRILLGAYLASLALIAFWPVPVDRGIREQVIYRALRHLWHYGVHWATYDRVEFAANILLFVPLGVLVTLVLRRWWAGVAVGALLSGGIELVQFIALPERYATLADIAANIVGALVGAVGTALVLRARRGRKSTRDDRPSSAAPDARP